MDKGCVGGIIEGDDLGEGMQCSNHPYRSSPGGICAFCLQEKLGKLVSSSKSNPYFCPIPPSSSSPSFRSEGGGPLGSSRSLSLSLSLPPSSSSSSNCNNYRRPGGVRSRIPFSVAQKKTKKTDVNSTVLKRSKSSAAPRRHHLSDADGYSPRKRAGFWSFLHLPSSSSSSSSRRRGSCRDAKGDSKPSVHPTPSNPNSGRHGAKDKCVGESSSSRGGDYGDENESPNSSHASSSSFGRKVGRSRSVGCGSRSFSGDFLERISTGFGDCTLRRVESQREAKQASKSAVVLRSAVVGVRVDEDRLDSHHHHHRMKEMVKCGGIFGGFSMASEDMSSNSASSVTTVPHGRSKSWGWAFASPMRAFRLSSSSSAKLEDDKDNSTGNAAKRSTNYRLQHNNNKDAADADAAVLDPNLAAIPSLLTVRS